MRDRHPPQLLVTFWKLFPIRAVTIKGIQLILNKFYYYNIYLDDDVANICSDNDNDNNTVLYTEDYLQDNAILIN